MRNPLIDCPKFQFPFYKTLVVLVAVFGFWMYYAALSLPHSLIDDEVFLKNTERWMNNLHEHGWTYALQNDVGMKQRVYNVAFMLGGVINYKLSGMQPFHHVRLMLLAWACLSIVLVCRQVLPRTAASAYIALAAVVVFFVGEAPAGINLQSLRANWIRLFCSDAEGICFLGGQALAVFQIYRNLHCRRPTWHLVVAAVLCGFMAFAYKVPFAAMATGPVFVSMGLAYYAGHRRLGHRYLAVFAGVVVLFGAFMLYVRSVAAGATGYAHAYGSDVIQSFDGLKAGWNFYKDAHWDVFGPLLIGGAMGLILLVRRLWKRRLGSGFLPLLALTYFAVFAAAAFGIYVIWSHLLLRYMLSCYFGLCILLALIAGYGMPLLIRLWRRRRWTLLLVPVGMAGAFAWPVVSAPVLLVAAVVGAWRRWTAVGAVAAGLMLVGFGYLVMVAPLVRSATNNYFIGREHANWKVAMDAMRMSMQEKNLCFVGDANNEHIGSIIGHLIRMGVPPRVYSMANSEMCTSGSVLITHRWLSPPEMLEQITGRPMIARYNLPSSEYKMHVSFWRWREKLFETGSDRLPYRVSGEPYVWILYGPEAP